MKQQLILETIKINLDVVERMEKLLESDKYYDLMNQMYHSKLLCVDSQQQINKLFKQNTKRYIKKRIELTKKLNDDLMRMLTDLQNGSKS